jgi:hypothetical protein
VRSFSALLCLIALAACGNLPRPFEGHPGATATRLAEPPPSRLAIPLPRDIFLGDAAAAELAKAIADGLLAEEVPVLAGTPQKGDWRLTIGTEPRGTTIVPLYRVLDPYGEQKGITEGLPVPADQWVRNPPLRRIAGEAVPRIASLLTRIEAARRQSDPNSLVNRPTLLAFTGVTGAPGDGNITLARAMRAELVKVGQDFADATTRADFTLAGTVTITPTTGNQQRVEIDWRVNDAKGSEAGRVVQLNEIPKGLLDVAWGDVAFVVAQEAAGGVHDVIANRVPKR